MKKIDATALYNIRFSGDDITRKNKIWRVICHNFFNKFIKPSDTVVDVACGFGEFISNISAHQKIAIDLNPETQRFLAPDIAFHQMPATEFGSVVRGAADVVFTSNFLEHLPDKQALDLFLDQVRIALKPGGRYLILGPNLRYLPGQYWDFYDHHLGLTHLSLCEALHLKGFEIDLCLDRFLPYSTKGGLPTHPLLVWLYLKFPLAWRVLGKQFFIVARQPAVGP